MTKVVIRTDKLDVFFSRAKDAARRADKGKAFDGKVTLSFEDSQRMWFCRIKQFLSKNGVDFVLIRLTHLPETYAYFQAGSEVPPGFPTVADGHYAGVLP